MVYGPAVSRRYGVTLGLNLLPLGAKVCPFRCAYCQLGVQRRTQHGPFPPLADLEADLATALQRGDLPHLDHLVFSGNGESTLHPEFERAVDGVLRLRDRHRPGLPVVLLTCGTELDRPAVARAAARLDEVAVKLDVGTQRLLATLVVPWQPLDLQAIALATARLPNAVVQTMLVTGRVDNTHDAAVCAWLDLVRQARPRRVDLYTLDRPAPDPRLRPAPIGRMAAIARSAEAFLQVPCRALGPGVALDLDQVRP